MIPPCGRNSADANRESNMVRITVETDTGPGDERTDGQVFYLSDDDKWLSTLEDGWYTEVEPEDEALAGMIEKARELAP
jgi:hypothetical protein